ncbi:MAG: TAT-variant-translocated molybdopterin oxidoreductase [Acidobacteria bacterium]|nr:TAT-variant-translocated molybdopterin oxidoreductase [Acidobacteriota bacterium]
MPNKVSNNSFAALRDKVLAQDGKQYWRSIEEFVDAPEFEAAVKEEYPHAIEDWDNSLSRRNFVKVMGASLALAGLSGCVIQPPEQIVPYVRPQEGLLPGVANYFATTVSLGGVGVGLLAKSYEGRPVKVEGNPEHPGSRGGTDAIAQASILGMYDPDRSQQITFRGSPSNWATFMTAVRTAIEENRADGGAGVRFLAETVTSPTLIDQFTRLKAELPNAKLIQYEPVNNDNVLAGAKMAFGSPAQPVYNLAGAKRILTLGADIFSSFSVANIKEFAKGRSVSEEGSEMNRLYAVETTPTLTGAKADHSIAVKPSQMTAFAKAVAKAVGVGGVESDYTENADWIAEMAKDLAANPGTSVVIAGKDQPPMVHAIANAINDKLGAVGKSVTFIEPLSPNAEVSQLDQLKELFGDIEAGKVRLLFILGGNPVYNTPIDLRIDGEKLMKVNTRVHLGLYADETAEYCQWHVPEKHFLEMWSDARAYDGTASIVQPLIEPLYGGKSIHEIVQLAFKENFEKKDLDIVKEFWQKTGLSGAAPRPAATPAATTAAANTAAAPAPANVTAPANGSAPAPAATPAAAAPAAATAVPSGFDANWRKAVHDGVIANSASPVKSVTASTGFLSQPDTKPAGSGALEIQICPDPCVYDGRFANNGWLQELPNPLNKVTWENVGLISPNTAAKLGINSANDPREMAGGGLGISFVTTKGGNLLSDLVTVKYQGAEIKKPVPMWVTPGQPDDVITIYMGYGRTRAGKVGTGLGYNAFDVRRSDAMSYGMGELAKTGEQTNIASTQIHFNMEGRDLLRVWNIEDYKANPDMGHQHDEYPKSMYPYEEHQKLYEQNYKWAMSIDLNSCVGCNACVVACQSENNIPVVGKEQVERSREMHWLRIDTYYGGDDINAPDGPHFQPVLCMQCEQAPCEVVCPVHATVHSAEGLNDMVYNRCVGTRYCSNNCPYKVRRFNFLLYQDWNTPQYKLMRNPEVTIRSRGVMEKCTFCTQRISMARIEAEKDGRKIRDGEVTTACQSACPAEAITFGDLHDKESKIYKAKKDHRDYKLLNELNTQPRTTYLAALKNPNKEMPDYLKREQRKPHVIGKKKAEKGGEAH